jgi:hypothetical protein
MEAQSGAPMFSMGHFWGGPTHQRHVMRHEIRQGTA